MLYFLFLYQIESGDLLYEKDFQADIDSHMDLFGSFFSALKSFISGMGSEGIEELKTIGLGDLIASIFRILEVNIDLVIIAEGGDKKEIQKLSSKLKSIILNYKELFLVDAVKSEEFENFDKDINEIVLSHRKILDPNALIEKQKKFLKSVWDQRGKISDQLRGERKDLEIERVFLVNNLLKEKNVLKKLSLCKLILEISDKLEDERFFLEYQKKAKIIANEINDIVLSHRKILDPTVLIEKQKDYLKSIWDQRGKISEQLREERKDIENERTIIVNKLLKENNVLKRFSLCKLILELSDKLEDEQFFLEYQKKAKSIANEIKDQKIRLKYYLNRAKGSLKVALDTFREEKLIEGDFKEVYSNLYSFSSKLKNFASVEVYEKYYHLASKLVYRKGISPEEFSLKIDEIRNMDENIESYLYDGDYTNRIKKI